MPLAIPRITMLRCCGPRAGDPGRARTLPNRPDELGRHAVIGPGLVHRGAAELQRPTGKGSRASREVDEGITSHFAEKPVGIGKIVRTLPTGLLSFPTQANRYVGLDRATHALSFRFGRLHCLLERHCSREHALDIAKHLTQPLRNLQLYGVHKGTSPGRQGELDGDLSRLTLGFHGPLQLRDGCRAAAQKTDRL